MTNLRLLGKSLVGALILMASAQANLIVNPPQPIDRLVTVQVIQVANDAGSSAAPLFGTAVQQAAIFGNVDTIYAQAGIDVQFTFRLGTYNDTFTLTGTPGANNPRSQGDLNTILSDAAAAGGVLAPDPVINLFMLRIVPGFSQTSDNTSNGLSLLDANGITLWAGPNLTGFAGGQEVIASVLSHEIGHNLGLDHLVEAENLMQAGGSPNPGQRLNATQINLIRGSDLVVVPEPSTMGLLVVSVVFALTRRPHWLRQQHAG